MSFKVKLLSETAKAPSRQSERAAGYDLYSSEDTKISPYERNLVPLGIAVAIPSGYYGRIAPRSGLSVKHSLDIGAGVIDEDYRGEVKVILFNHGSKEFIVNNKDRIAQMILVPVLKVDFEEVDDLPETVRGSGGFGSTGKWKIV